MANLLDLDKMQKNNKLPDQACYLLRGGQTEDELALLPTLGAVVLLKFSSFTRHCVNVKATVDWAEIDQLLNVAFCIAPIVASSRTLFRMLIVSVLREGGRYQLFQFCFKNIWMVMTK